MKGTLVQNRHALLLKREEGGLAAEEGWGVGEVS